MRIASQQVAADYCKTIGETQFEERERALITRAMGGDGVLSEQGGEAAAAGGEDVLLRRGTKGSTLWGKMGIEWDSRDGPNGHQPTASICDLYLSQTSKSPELASSTH